MMIAMVLTMGVQLVGRLIKDCKNGIIDSQKVNWIVAERLKRLGVAPGDIVGSAGNTPYATWAYLAEVSIVADIPDTGRGSFWWAGDPQAKEQVFEAIARTGAKVLVADRRPTPKWSADWQQIGNTPFYVHFLSQPGG